MKAIETEYKGYKFRSRLEARWAVFFDAIGIKWEYEPEGYQFDDGTMYLPDFKLLNVKNRSCKAIFVEVKGNMKDEDMHKIDLFSKEHPILVIKSIEDAEEQLQFWEGGISWSFDFIDGDSYPCMFTKHCDEIWLAGPDHDEWDMGELMKKGIKAAKQARFEHGEQPFVNSEIIKLENIEDKLEKLYDICDTSTESGRIDFLKKASNIIAEEKSPLSREVYIQSVCKKSNIPILVLKPYVDVIVKRNRYANKYNIWHHTDSEDANTIKAKRAEERTKRAEEMIIFYLLKRPQEWKDVEKAIPPDYFVTPFHKKVYSALLNKMRDVDKFDILMLNSEFTQEEMGRISRIVDKNAELPISFDAVRDCANVVKEFKPIPSVTDNELMNLFRRKNSKE